MRYWGLLSKVLSLWHDLALHVSMQILIAFVDLDLFKCVLVTDGPSLQILGVVSESSSMSLGLLDPGS